MYEYTKSAEENLITIQKKRATNQKKQGEIKLRDYQEEAIAAWKDNGYRGFFVMATGTGKTWTAIFSAKELLKTTDGIIVICAPYKHLIKQWVEDLEVAFSGARIIMVSSENSNWQQQLREVLLRAKYGSTEQIIVVSTISSFNLDRFQSTLNISDSKKLLIVDEAHRFNNRTDRIKEKFEFMLGLSATPFSGRTAKTGKELMDYFGGQVFNLPIESALERGFLVPYKYHPIFVNATEDEERAFTQYTQRMMGYFRNGVCVDPEGLAKAHRGRLRVISMAEEKLIHAKKIIDSIGAKDHFIIYCGDGRLFNDNGDETRHIGIVKNILNEMGYKPSQFTAQESMLERMELIDAFNKDEISCLVAIRCLDEGVNIPSIATALILSSNDNYREFVQRRGRILRTYPGKDSANIYDVVVLPSSGMSTWATIELRRFYEYAHLASNWEELKGELDQLISDYQLLEEDVVAYNYDEMEDTVDE